LKIQPLKISILDKYPKKLEQMKKEYYNPEDLKKFGDITQWNKELGDRFFEYYNKVFEEGELSAREKSLIALAVAHVVQCPYCIDAYTKDGLQRGIEKEEMMEAIHVGAAIKGGAVLVHGVQMMNRHDQLSM
jgi:alkylhydroperoxidase/carboxymuconolactone decarboxylase family protein